MEYKIWQQFQINANSYTLVQARFKALHYSFFTYIICSYDMIWQNKIWSYSWLVESDTVAISDYHLMPDVTVSNHNGVNMAGWNCVAYCGNQGIRPHCQQQDNHHCPQWSLSFRSLLRIIRRILAHLLTRKDRHEKYSEFTIRPPLFWWPQRIIWDARSLL